MKTFLAVLFMSLGLLNPFQDVEGLDTDYYLMNPVSFCEDDKNDIRYITFEAKEWLDDELDSYEMNSLFSETEKFINSELTLRIDYDDLVEMDKNRYYNLYVTKEQYEILQLLNEKNYPVYVKLSSLLKVDDFKTMDSRYKIYSPKTVKETEELIETTDSLIKTGEYTFKGAKETDETVIITVWDEFGKEKKFEFFSPTEKETSKILSYKRNSFIYIKSISIKGTYYIVNFDNAAG